MLFPSIAKPSRINLINLLDNAALWSPFAAMLTISTSSNPQVTSGRLNELTLPFEIPSWPRFPDPKA